MGKEIVKVCKVHGALTEDEIVLIKRGATRKGYKPRCRACDVERRKIWNKNNAEYKRKSYEKNKKKYLIAAKEYRKKNKEILKIKKGVRVRNYIESLHESYLTEYIRRRCNYDLLADNTKKLLVVMRRYTIAYHRNYKQSNL